jgi:formate dehydrogenase iron-sulfur subunit
MSVDRRTFFKISGIAGLSLIAGRSSGTELQENSNIEFMGILYDSTRCLGCRACELACCEENNLPEPQDEMITDVIRQTSESQRTVVNMYNTSKGEVLVKNQCMHCNDPACAAACLTKAMYKTKEGPVIWDEKKCMGCRYCMVSCPFDVPKFEYHSANPKIQKCDLCYDRIAKGEIPACVEICGEALTFGTRRELIAEARKRIAENPELYHPEIYGETVAGGTGILYLSPAPHNEIGLNTNLQNSSYPALTKGFLYSVPAVFILAPTLLLGIHAATKNNNSKENEDE